MDWNSAAGIAHFNCHPSIVKTSDHGNASHGRLISRLDRVVDQDVKRSPQPLGLIRTVTRSSIDESNVHPADLYGSFFCSCRSRSRSKSLTGTDTTPSSLERGGVIGLSSIFFATLSIFV